MLKLMCAVIGVVVLVAVIAVSAGFGTMESPHAYLLADGGQPPPGPLPICWPWDYPCPPPQGGGNQLLANFSAASVTAVVMFDRPRPIVSRAA